MLNTVFDQSAFKSRRVSLTNYNSDGIDQAAIDVPLFELLLLLIRRGIDMGGPTCGAIPAARDAALLLTGTTGAEIPPGFTVMLNLQGPSELSPYSIISDILM